MPHFIRLVKFNEKGLNDPILYKNRRAEFLEQTKKLGIKIIAEYATLGRYDIITILDAPDTEAVIKLTVAQAQKGRTKVETLRAVTTEEFEKILNQS